jgi:hypothetical protein
MPDPERAGGNQGTTEDRAGENGGRGGGASRSPLLGTWKLKSCVMTADTGERSTPYGEHPIGYLSYSADGRMYAFGTSRERGSPIRSAPTDRERAALYDSMFAYAGAYSVESGKVTHHVDVSWNEVWNGTDQIRFYELNGNILTITARIADPTDGTEAQYVLEWDRVPSSTQSGRRSTS